MAVLLRYLGRGVLVVVPLVATIYVVVVIVSKLDGLLGLGVPGVGLVLTLALLTLVGFLVSNVVGASLLRLVESVLAKLPLVRMLYNSIKDLASAFVGEKKGFDRPVCVELPGVGLVLGFQTREAVPAPGFEDYVAVYFPQSYNFAGNLLMVPRARVRPLEVARSDFMTFIVSGGVSGEVHPPARHGHDVGAAS